MDIAVLNPASPTTDKSAIVPYTPPVSDIVFDPLKMLERERQIQLNELQILTDAPPGVLLEGTGPEVLVGLDAEWGYDPATQSNIVTSVQFHVVGECGEFAHIHYVKGGRKGDRPKFDKLLTGVILMAMEAGVVLEFPKSVTVSAFFLRADLTAFSDLARFKTQFDSVGGSVGTRGEGIAFDAHIEPQDIERLTRSRRFIVDDEGRGRVLWVRFVDLVRHTPVGTNLAEVGTLLGQEKIELPPGAIENMPQLLIDDPELYAEYAAQDALIAVYFLCSLKESIARLLGKPKLPLTNSGVSVSLFKKTLKDAGLKFNEVFGRRMQRVSVWDEENGRVRTVSEDALLPMRAIHAAFVTMTAHGGRGECFHVGPTPVGVWYDIDLASAYTTVLAMLGLVDFEHPYVCLDIRQFIGHVLGFALVEFRHSEHVRAPVFPVEGEGQNLFFVRSGISYCTAPEIEAALHIDPEMEIRILHGVIYPWKDANVRPFEHFVTTIRDQRAQYPKGSFDNDYIKLCGNGLFGRTGMGLKPKNVFDAGELKSVQLEPDEMTNEVFFSFTMGFVRALIGELLNSVPCHRRLVSVTTDGFLTDAPLAEIDQSGPLATRFKAATARVAPGKPILEVKHRTRQIVSARVRAQFTGLIDPSPDLKDEERFVLAKGNVIPEIDLPEGDVTKPMIKALQNAYMIDLYLNRTPASKTMMRPFVSLRQQWTEDLDVFRIERPVRLGLEFDWKRKALNPRMETVGEGAAAKGPHIALDTEPWDTVEEAEAVRVVFNKAWREEHCLKTLEDWTHWADFSGGAIKRRRKKADGGAGIHRTKEGEVGVLRRTFLRAYAQEAWGLEKTETYGVIAAWLSDAGYPTTETELKNARRAKLGEGVVGLNDEVKALLAVLRGRFPKLEVARFVGEADARLIGPEPV
ncbi:hypothetical protein [Hydrogenophaga sp.]|uniref:hypothetical protein n=1 Tax=Hydrogenophaga sp. TaxID=1904254 RepID=UPI0035B06ACA